VGIISPENGHEFPKGITDVFMTAPERWLLALADPENPGRKLPRQKLAQDEILPMCLHAELHGVLPAVLKNVDRLLRNEAGTLLLEPGFNSEAITAIQPLQSRLAEKTAIALFLGAESRRISAAIQANGAVTITLKGADFAERLYTPPAFRLFGDLDLLARVDDWDCVSGVMSRLGYVRQELSMKYASGYSEETWQHPAMPGASVEVHDNLVNSPTLRRGVSVKFEDLPLERNIEGQLRPTPAGLLIIAAVHAAASHSFDKLQHLCDIAQIVRGRAGAIDESSLRECLSKTGAGFSVALGLDLVERAFGETAAADLLARLKYHWPKRLMRLLITPALIARSQGKRRRNVSWRRQTLRQMLKSRR